MSSAARALFVSRSVSAAVPLGSSWQRALGRAGFRHEGEEGHFVYILERPVP